MSTDTLGLTPQAGDPALKQQWLKEARRTGESDEHTRKHRDPRITWHEPLEVHVALSGGRTESHYATACDISEGGIGFRCRLEIPAFTQITVCRAGEMVGLPAMTLHCMHTLTGYTIGAQFRFEQPPKQQVYSKVG